ncbi:hypothetical protein DPMN_081515 [Dreissena polymorpha]|uniref:Uncharacterized protein n=1 Tax=Dreissena polymorpha TaxID=45954 RepID=A0A9D3Y883_DREPO|nr:hypothetical protein DPMN_081515 [Dreissena polymorpha]
MAKDWIYSFGHFFPIKIFWYSAVISAGAASSSCLISSEVTLFTPSDFPGFKVRTASSYPSFSMDRLSLYTSGLGDTEVWLKRVVVEVAGVFSPPAQDCGTLGQEITASVCYNTGLWLTGLREGLDGALCLFSIA